MVNQLHFLQPLWLISLIPLAGLLWLLYKQKTGNSAWSKIIDANLLPLLLKGSENKTNRLGLFLLASAWFIGVIALADLVWEKVPRPIFQTNAARVIVLDLSRSMLIPDLKPSRLSRARFKIEDILARTEEGQTGLVVFAGAAFTAAPLTRDSDTLRSLLNVLKPDIMPAQGSRADLGLLKAQELLQQANIKQGQVLLIADGVVGKMAEIAAKKLHDNGYTVSVLGVGTEAGGRIPNLRQAITVKLESNELQTIAKLGGGNYQLISNTNHDLEQLLNPLTSNNTDNESQKNRSDLQNQDWKSNAPFLILLLLPLAAFAFRRGWLLNLFLVIGLVSLSVQPQTVFAEEAKSTSFKHSLRNTWKNLWQRQDQQADKALQQQQYKQALELSKDPLRRGSALYKQGDYTQALDSFSQATGPDADYNRGNTLAKLEKYQDAIKAYKKTLAQDKHHADAQSNMAIIEKRLKEQKQHKDKDNKQDKSQSGDKKGNQDKKQDDKKEQQKNKQKSDDEKGKQKDKSDNKKESKEEGKEDKQGENNQFSDAAKQLDSNKKADDKKEEQLDKENEKNKSGNKKNEEDANKDKSQQADSKKTKDSNNPEKNNKQDISGTKAEAEELTKEEKIAAEQWLRRIPDDPGGLLRRKFTRQYRRHTPQRRGPANNTNFW